MIRGWLLAIGLVGLGGASLYAELPDEFPKGFDRLQIVGPCGYSFGLTLFAGDVYYTDFNAQSIFRLRNGKPEPVLTGIPALYGITTGKGEIFYATDGDQKDAAIHRWMPDTNPETVFRGMTRPRQLFYEDRGALLFALEGEGRIVRLDLKSRELETLAEGMTAPQAVVSEGEKIFFSQYGTMNGDGTPLVQGQLSLLDRGKAKEKEIIKIWRARGLSLLGPDRLAVLSESDEQDHGSSASFRIVDSAGKVSLLVQGFDYPQFNAQDGVGNVFTTAPRDRVVLKFLTGASEGEEKQVQLGRGVSAFASVLGKFSEKGKKDVRELRIRGAKNGPFSVWVEPDPKGRFAGWIRIPAEEFPELSRQELKYPDPATQTYTPGVFAVPNLEVAAVDGAVLRHHVIPQRGNKGVRWPMTHVGTGKEAPAPGFSEEPVAYLVYLEVGEGG
jgi:hypothetical protein